MSERWGAAFDADELARLELRAWKAYYRHQPLKLFGLLVLANHEQAHASWPRALLAAFYLARGAYGFSRARDAYDRYLPDIERGYRMLALPADVNVSEVARHELRWWVVRREIGVAAGDEAGKAITQLYSAIYLVPEDAVAEAGRLRGLAAEMRDRGAADEPAGPAAKGSTYWPEVARLLRDSYRSLKSALAAGA